jgi:hypothetical protein
MGRVFGVAPAGTDREKRRHGPWADDLREARATAQHTAAVAARSRQGLAHATNSFGAVAGCVHRYGFAVEPFFMAHGSPAHGNSIGSPPTCHRLSVSWRSGPYYWTLWAADQTYYWTLWAADHTLAFSSSGERPVGNAALSGTRQQRCRVWGHSVEVQGVGGMVLLVWYCW